MKKAAKPINSQLEHHRLDSSFSEAWSLYHDSFDDNQEEVLLKLGDAFRSAVITVTPLNLSGTVSLFKDLGAPEKAAELLAYYMANRNEPRGFYDLSQNLFGSDVRDPDVVSAFSQKLASFEGNRDAASILENVVKNSGWNPEDIKWLAATVSADQYKKILKENRGIRLRRIIQAALSFGSAQNASEEGNTVAARMADALRDIGRESKINARRARKYGISLDEPAQIAAVT